MDVHVVVTTSCNYEHIYKFFRESMANAPQNVHVHERIVDLSQHNNDGSFQTSGWYYACRAKLINLLDFMHVCPHINFIIMSDADINFLNPAGLEEFVAHANANCIDYYGMRENQENKFNTGFFVIRNNLKCHELLEEVINRLAVERPNLADQDIINSLILNGNKYDLKHEFIPSDKYVWGESAVYSSAVFHHAVATNNKVAQMQRIAQRFSSIRS